MRIFTVRWGDTGQELLRESAYISLAVIGSGDAGRGRALDSGEGSLVGLNPTNGADEVGERSGFIQKSSALVLDQFGDSGDRGSEDEFLVRHRLHQHYGDSLAFAGHHDQVGVTVIAGKVGAEQVTDQVNAAFQP